MLSFSKYIFLFALNLSFIVLINCSTFPLPLWSYTGHLTCFMKYFSQNLRNSLLVKAVPGSVLIYLGIPLSARFLCKNSTTLRVVGARKNFESYHPVLLSIDTIKYFLELFAVLNGPAKLMAISSFVSSGVGILRKFFIIGFIDVSASWQFGQLSASNVMLSLPGSPHCKDILIGVRRIFGIPSQSSTFSKLFSSSDNALKSFAPRAV